MRHARAASIAVWTASVLYAVAYFVIGVWRFEIYRAELDMGLFTQVLSSAFSGFHSTAEGNVNHLAVHFSPILFLAAPLVIATHSVWTMIAWQAVACALVAPPIFFIARKRIGPLLAAGCAICALLYPPLAGVTFTDFHEAGMEPAAIAWLIWAIDAGKVRAAIALAIVALCIKEDVAPGLVFGGALAAAWFFRRHDAVRGRVSLSIAALALATFAFYFLVLRPALAGGVPYASFHFYDYYRTTPTPAGFVPPWSLLKTRYI
jgi:uncharacterized membrane protein